MKITIPLLTHYKQNTHKMLLIEEFLLQFKSTALQLSENAVKTLITLFLPDSFGGPDSIRPQHILDMINYNITRPALLKSIINFGNILLRGECR